MRYFDLHCDTARVCYKNKIFPDDTSLAVSAANVAGFEEWYQCFAVFIPDNCTEPKTKYVAQINDFKGKLEKFNSVNPIFTLENALPIESLDFIDVLADDGIRAVTLTWNGENNIAGGAYTDTGLKPYGKEVIGKLNSKRIAVDLSHLNRKSFFEVAESAEIIFASHSCCDKTHRHKRNLTDEQLKVIKDRNGVVGICFYPEFLGTKYAFEGVWRHINHLLNIGLEENISIGSDFDGADMSNELDGVDKIPDLYSFLFERGLDNRLLNKIFFKNAYEFFKKF